MRVIQSQQGRVPLMSAQKNSLFFQPTSKTLTSQRNGDSPGQISQSELPLVEFVDQKLTGNNQR